MNRDIDPATLPTLGQLHRASAGAIVMGAVLAVTTILPAEWGIDPTGVGNALGLTAMGRLKTADAAPASVSEDYARRSDTVVLTLRPNEGTEVKASLRKGDTLDYSWKTSGGEPLFFDFHGVPARAASDVFTSFEKATREADEGTFEAPFEGTHGWYWKNKTTEPVSLTVTVDGVYRGFGQR